jgi:hypothetical protein
MPFIRLHRIVGDDDAPDGPLHFVAATGGQKADGIDLADLPWDFSRGVPSGDGNGKRFPFLWVHDLAGENLPLGVADVVTADDELPMRVRVSLDPDDEFAQRVARKYRSPVGGLEAVSVSWDDVDDAGVSVRATGKKPTAHQLLEVSAVPVGLDPLALQEGERVAFRALAAEVARMLDDDRDSASAVDDIAECAMDGDNTERAEPDEGGWADVAAGMVEALTRAPEDTDAARHRSYKRLLPAYRFLGKTPPEWIDGDELRALDDANWRALFLSGELDAIEVDQRAGAELSGRNIQELSAAAEAIQTGLDRIVTLLERVRPADVQKGQPGKGEDDDDDGGERAVADGGADMRELAAFLDKLATAPAGADDNE